MAHLAPAWPEQTLCKENKRKAILEQQRKWLEQRAAEQRAAEPATIPVNKAIGEEKDEAFDDAELNEINGFIAGIGQSLAADSPPTATLTRVVVHDTSHVSSGLQELLGMGFTDKAQCLKALESAGDVAGAVAALCADEQPR